MSDNRNKLEGSRESSSGVNPMPVYNSDELFGSASEVQIEHSGQLYRLRRTSLGKLILTK